MKTEPTEALKEIKHCTWTAEDFNISDGLESYKVVDEDDAINIANIAFREGQSSPKIKQLEWIVAEGTETRLANAPSNNYYIIDVVDGMIFLTINVKYHTVRYTTIDEAKAAAQADFERRVMECLDIVDNSNK